jgi:hypothetical protein
MNDERLNDRTNERSEFQQHNGRKKIIWTNERTNERSDERTNEPRIGGRMIEERPNDPCASVCLCGTWSGCVGGGESCHEMAWGGMRGGPCPSIYSHGGGLGGGMRGLVGG